MNFWQNLPANFLVLAPMDDATDTVFRQIVAQAAAPDVLFTEFTSVDGFCSRGRKVVERKLKFDSVELSQPLVAQIWGSDPENYFKTAEVLASSGFSGIDINMGCPEKTIVRRGCCSALINDHARAAAIVEATKAGAGQLPVSVKTRIGFKEIATDDWIGFLLGLGLAALTVHGRTTREMSRVPAHWDEITRAVQFRDQLSPETIIIGNGDVMSRAEALDRMVETGADGVMIGRGIFHNLFVFEREYQDHSPSEYLSFLLRHLDLFESTWTDQKSFEVMKKYIKIYVSGYPGAVELRQLLMGVTSVDQARMAINRVLEDNLVLAS